MNYMAILICLYNLIIDLGNVAILFVTEGHTASLLIQSVDQNKAMLINTLQFKIKMNGEHQWSQYSYLQYH